jgi:hypothetical protein
VLGDNPVISLINSPMPLPSVVQLSEIVGFPEVFQHTPWAVTIAPPLSVTFPPHSAELSVIFESESVASVGKDASFVVNETVSP